MVDCNDDLYYTVRRDYTTRRLLLEKYVTKEERLTRNDHDHYRFPNYVESEHEKPQTYQLLIREIRVVHLFMPTHTSSNKLQKTRCGSKR